MPGLSGATLSAGRWLVQTRAPLACANSAIVGAYGLLHYPFPQADPVAVLVAAHTPALLRAVEVLYAILWFSTPYWLWYVVSSTLFVFGNGNSRAQPAQPLPPYPAVQDRQTLSLVVGELHHPTERIPSPTPRWLTIPARGLHAGVAILGAIGSGKTAGAMYPFCEQILGFAASDPERKAAGLVVEAKGDFCAHVRDLLRRYGREQDYFELSPGGAWRYNPLAQDADAYALAYTIASVMQQVWGRSREPFWELASTHLIKHLILLHRLLYDYVTFIDLYSCAISPALLEARIKEAGRLPCLQAGTVTVSIAMHASAREATQGRIRWEAKTDGQALFTEATPFVLSALTSANVPFRHDAPAPDERKRLQWESVKLWYEQDWTNLDVKLRTAIVEGVSVFLSMFDTDQQLRHTFCPSRECYEAADAHSGCVLPSFTELIERGYVCGLNFPVATNPALARVIVTMCKMDFERAVLARIPRMSAALDRIWRDVLLLIDEAHLFVTAGEDHPGGDEQALALSRQARLIPIFATPSVSSLKSTLPNETWRRILEALRTKLILAQSDDFSAQYASNLAGNEDHIRPTYNISESNRDAGVSWLTGRAVGKNASLGTTTVYSWQREPTFEPKVFMELQNMEAIVFAYDGRSPLPPQRCYLKPYYLPVNETHFAHVAAGRL